jgi:antitoxin (DNA-binding transcriptional repressor) of toxin-antitoxin stability system
VKFVSTRELRINPSKVLDGLTRHGAVITRHGKPAAALLPLTEDDIEEFVLSRHPRFRKEIEDAIREYDAKGGVDHETMVGMIREKARRKRLNGKRQTRSGRA